MMCFVYKLAPVVQRLDNAIQRINHYPVDKTLVLLEQNKPRYPWIVIYPVDSVVHLSNNPGQAYRILF